MGFKGAAGGSKCSQSSDLAETLDRLRRKTAGMRGQFDYVETQMALDISGVANRSVTGDVRERNASKDLSSLHISIDRSFNNNDVSADGDVILAESFRFPENLLGPLAKAWAHRSPCRRCTYS